MSNKQPATVPATSNVVVLHGTIANEPDVRQLRDGRRVVQFDLRTVAVDGDDRSESVTVPLSWTDPREADRALVVVGAEVVVAGTVRRRFFRVGGQIQSRTEVVVGRLVPTRRRKSARSLVEAVAAELTTGFG